MPLSFRNSHRCLEMRAKSSSLFCLPQLRMYTQISNAQLLQMPCGMQAWPAAYEMRRRKHSARSPHALQCAVRRQPVPSFMPGTETLAVGLHMLFVLR